MRTKAKDNAPSIVNDALKKLGERLREARIKRGWSRQTLAMRIGVHESTLMRLEAGDHGITLAILACALNELDGLKGFCGMDLFRESNSTDVDDGPVRRRATSVRIPARLNLDKYPQLRQLAWNRAGKDMAAEDALPLYERNWRFIDVSGLTLQEARLIERLKKKFGHGVLNV